ncbi:hypothetical protein E2C01_087197 [Portunus trituberculatus]|uniref:Uncharacterized protein n=1 Tax=Portunus trituberculatus TaxID=210409 RepID=A0A5B7JBT0_PORTR|nr:hypothetical protein [Portunus trituberculatus]
MLPFSLTFHSVPLPSSSSLTSVLFASLFARFQHCLFSSISVNSLVASSSSSFLPDVLLGRLLQRLHSNTASLDRILKHFCVRTGKRLRLKLQRCLRLQ